MIYIYISKKARTQDQPTLETFVKGTEKYSSSNPQQQQITDALIMFIAGDLLPLATVESDI